METHRKRGRDTANPTSRPVYLLFRNYNLNPVIDARSRWWGACALR